MSSSDDTPKAVFTSAKDLLGHRSKFMMVGPHRIYHENPRSDGKKSKWMCIRCKATHREQQTFESHGCTPRVRHGNLKVIHY